MSHANQSEIAGTAALLMLVWIFLVGALTLSIGAVGGLVIGTGTVLGLVALRWGL